MISSKELVENTKIRNKMLEKLKPGEHSPFYEGYIRRVSQPNVGIALQESKNDFLSFIQSVPSDKMDYAYENGKWTIKEVIQHIIDTERVFSYRALRFARNDKTDLPGYDQDQFAQSATVAHTTKESLLNDYVAVRNASISLFRNFTPQMLEQIGTAGGNPMSCRVAGYIMVGHQQHHLTILRERYFTKFDQFLNGSTQPIG